MTSSQNSKAYSLSLGWGRVTACRDEWESGDMCISSDDKSILPYAPTLIVLSPAKPGWQVGVCFPSPSPSPPGVLTATVPLTRHPLPSSDLNPTFDERILEPVTKTENIFGKASTAWGLSPVLKEFLDSDLRTLWWGQRSSYQSQPLANNSQRIYFSRISCAIQHHTGKSHQQSPYLISEETEAQKDCAKTWSSDQLDGTISKISWLGAQRFFCSVTVATLPVDQTCISRPCDLPDLITSLGMASGLACCLEEGSSPEGFFTVYIEHLKGENTTVQVSSDGV